MNPTNNREEQEYADWILRVEARAILPLKWVTFAVCAVMWMWASRWTLPPLHVFMLFFLYAMFNATATFFVGFDRVPLQQVKMFVITSYLVDLVFVTLLFWFDALERLAPGFAQSEFYLLYFLMVLRGFALFRSPQEHLFMSCLISALFVASIWASEHSFSFIYERAFIVKFALIWLVILLTWFIIEIINQQQREVMRVRERLLRSENLARLGEVAAGIAHEINNPIGIISAYSEFLMRQTSKDDPLQADYDTIHRESLRCKTIIGQMLLLAQPGSIQFAPVDLRPLLEEVYGEVLRDDADRARVRIESDFGPDMPAVRGQPDQLRQAFLNVLVNARQALPEDGGTIRVAARRLAGRRPPNVQILITDTGAGISPEDAEKAFEPFYTKKPKGTGLGLAVTRRIIEAHGGLIALRPADLPPGATVEILLAEESGNAD